MVPASQPCWKTFAGSGNRKPARFLSMIKTIDRYQEKSWAKLLPLSATFQCGLSHIGLWHRCYGAQPHLGRFESLKKTDQEIIDWALKQTNIYELKDRNINELSGGESQLSIIARAFATEATLILLDEPTSELDIKHTLAIISALYTLKEQRKPSLLPCTIWILPGSFAIRYPSFTVGKCSLLVRRNRRVLKTIYGRSLRLMSERLKKTPPFSLIFMHSSCAAFKVWEKTYYS